MRLTLASVVLIAVLASESCQQPQPAVSQPRPIRVLMGLDVTTLDPQVPWDDVSSVILDNIFDSLVRFDRSFRLTSGLAQRWINPDERTWRFFLDPVARFPDGSPLRASDVKFSIERLRSLAGSQMTGFTRHIASTEVVDELTIDVHTDTPVAILNSLAFIPIMSEKQVKAAGDKIGERPFGTGAYKLGKWEKGKLIVLEANEHHTPQPAIKRAEFAIRRGREVLEQTLRDRPEVTLFLGLGALDELQKKRPSDLKVVSGGGLAVWYVALNQRPQIPGSPGANPLRDARVRRAVAHATDQAALVKEYLRGFGRPATQLIPPQVFGFDPLIEPTPYSPSIARELLAKAGHPGLQFSVETQAGGSHRLEKILIGQWEKAGIRATLRERSDADYQKAIDAGSFDVAVEGYSCTSADASELLNFSLRSRDAAKGYGVGNIAAYSSPEVDRIAEENLRLFDPKRRLELLQKALRVAAQDLPYLPLYAAEDIYVVSDAIEWTPPVNGEVRMQDMTFRSGSARP